MMRNQCPCWVLGLSLAIPGWAWGQAAEFYPLELVKAGQKGYGKTVFEVDIIERFDVEIIGVLKNVGPKQNLILARLTGERLAETGVFAGISGSPVYMEEKIVGAVAYAFPFSKEAIAGITPIHEIVSVFKEAPETRMGIARRHPRSLYRLTQPEPRRVLQEFRVDSVFPELKSYGSLHPISTPLNLSGFSPQALEPFLPHFESMGLTPVRGTGSAESRDRKSTPLQPGSTISVQLVRGDMDLSVSGTVTHVSGNRIYAFGHPFLSIGHTDMPLNKAEVLTIIPSLFQSQKVSATTELVGSIKQDRATGILGISGEQARLIPVQLRLLTSRKELKEFNYEVITDSFLTPFLVTFTVYNSIISSERAIGGQTLQTKCTISVKDHPQVNFENSVSSLMQGSLAAALAASSPVGFLLNSGFEDLVMEKIDIEIGAAERTREAILDKVWQDRLEARPGEEVNLTVFLRLPNGETVAEKYPVKIPEGIRPGPLKIMVADGHSVEKLDEQTEGAEFIPQTLNQLIRAINNLKKNDRLYIRLFRDEPGVIIAGEGLPELPPSLLALYNSVKTSGDVRSINKVIYVEHELPATDFVLSGQQVIQIQVKS